MAPQRERSAEPAGRNAGAPHPVLDVGNRLRVLGNFRFARRAQKRAGY